ncbi:SulP family inorganic anion transporter [Candidatus Gracilibacteria bacterium]|nr:SulP family inorganic anion transporter [Candidatus Gracilibacteria bacterium]
MNNKKRNHITLNKIFPFLTWIGELRNKKTLKADIVAGITVALILVPQSMAYAKLAELPLEVGLYTAFIPVIMAALFGSSRQMSTGPVTIVSLMTATALAPIAITGTAGYIAYASILALFIGIFYIFLGLIRGGIIVEFLSHPVITGFTNAVAIITIISQLPKIFGVLKPTNFSHYIDYIYQIFGNIISSTDIATLIIGVSSMLVLILMKKYVPKIPRVLVLIVISIITTASLFNLDSTKSFVQSVDIVRNIDGGLPYFSLPFMSEEVLNKGLKGNLEIIRHLALYGIIIALIGFTASISVAKFVGAKTKQRVGANRELIGQGIANISSGLFGGMGVAGSFSKTAVNLKAGAKTGFSSIVTGFIVGITILFLLDLLYYLPIATLSAIIIVSVFDLIKFKPLITAWKVEKHDGIVGIITFIVTLSLTPSIELGILTGIVLSLMFYIYRSMRPRFSELGMFKDGLYRDAKRFGLKTSKHISVFRFDSSLYFANSGYFESKVLEYISKKKNLKYIIIDMEWISNIDSSGLEMLKDLVEDLQGSSTTVYFTSIRVKVLQKLYKVGFIKHFGKKNIFIRIEDAIEHIDKKDGDKTKTKNLEEYQPDKTAEKDRKLEKYILKKYMRD